MIVWWARLKHYIVSIENRFHQKLNEFISLHISLSTASFHASFIISNLVNSQRVIVFFSYTFLRLTLISASEDETSIYLIEPFQL